MYQGYRVHVHVIIVSTSSSLKPSVTTGNVFLHYQKRCVLTVQRTRWRSTITASSTCSSASATRWPVLPWRTPSHPSSTISRLRQRLRFDLCDTTYERFGATVLSLHDIGCTCTFTWTCTCSTCTCQYSYAIALWFDSVYDLLSAIVSYLCEKHD